MDKYEEECKACWCKKAQEMMYGYDVWFNCNSCPFAECYEPDTKEQYLSGVTEREADYIRFEEAEKLRQMERDEYKRSDSFKEHVAFAESIKQKVQNNVLLTPEEFEQSLSFRWTRASEYIDFIHFTELVKYQLSAIGYEGAAKEIVNYIESLWGY